MLEASEKQNTDVVFELCPIEGSQGTFKILQYSLLYSDGRASAASAKPDSQWLVQAFDKLIEHYPITLGHRVQQPDRNTVVVSQDDRNKQRVYQHTEDALTVAAFDQIKYRRDMWPPALSQVLSERTADIECLISAVIVRLCDGYLITLSVSHIVADVAGVAVLLQQWSSIAEQLLLGKPSDGGKVVPKLPVDFGHPKFWEKLKAHPPDSHPYVDHILGQDFENINEFQAKIATFYKTGTLEDDGLLAMRVLHVSAANIAKIAEQFNANSEYRPLHGVQIMYALLWQRYVVAALDVRPTAPSNDAPIFLNLLHNARGLVSSPDYVGNGVTAAYVLSTVTEITQLSVIELARKIKPYVNSVTPGAAVHLIEAICDTKSMFAVKAYCAGSTAASLMSISNASRMPFYDIDFGLGKPAAVLNGTRPTEGMAFWLPCKDGGVDINFGLKNDIYCALKNDKILGELVCFVN
ncbi:hypothetical protein GGF43_001291 [Coemansia sp. RSA 2618]|nr:hypothetical protein GGF43_001291 [Coemansia sp. RSA 2618]